jgi:hypothetical protein
MEGIERRTRLVVSLSYDRKGTEAESKEIDSGGIFQRFNAITIIFGYLTVEHELSGSWEEYLGSIWLRSKNGRSQMSLV